MECMRNDFVEGVLLDGRYRTIAPLNHGSFGMVFKARDTFTGDFVALKCLTKPSAAHVGPSAISVDDRSEELAIHRRIGHHPNIVNLLDSFETANHFYLVIEYCPNGDLYEAIRVGRGPLETSHVREFMLELIHAVEFLHTRKIYHRDIKPENIFLSQNGSMKLGDFGLATSESPNFEAAVGSDRYMAPEQYDPQDAGYDPAKADIWAIGICLLNVLFSRNPFATPTFSDPLFADFAGDRQTLFDVFPNMSQDTFEVLTHCLALDPANRSLAKAKAALRRVITFTTDNETIDDFCTDEATSPVPASANREPLRTPSVSSPHVNAGAFPWAKALAMSPPQPVRRLSAIPDSEYASEDLFGTSMRSGEVSEDWFSVKPDSASISSAVDSGLGVSLRSEANAVPIQRTKPVRVPGLSGSLPAFGPNFSSVFSRTAPTFSKSWSDLWDEDNDEEEAAQEADDASDQEPENESREHLPFPASDLQLAPTKTITSLKAEEHLDSSPSSGHDTPRAGSVQEHACRDAIHTRVRTPSRARDDADNVSVSEQTGFFFEDCNTTPTPHHAKLAVQPATALPTPRATPVKPSVAPWSAFHTPAPHRFGPMPTPATQPARSSLDKWAELGDRRRAHPIRERAKSVATKRDVPKAKQDDGDMRAKDSTRALSWRRPRDIAAIDKPDVPALPKTPGYLERERTKEWAISRDWRKHGPATKETVDRADDSTTVKTPDETANDVPTRSNATGFFNFGVKRTFGSSLANGFGFASWARNNTIGVKDSRPSSRTTHDHTTVHTSPTHSTSQLDRFHFDADHQRPPTTDSGASTPRMSSSSSGWVCRDQPTTTVTTPLQASQALRSLAQADAAFATGSGSGVPSPMATRKALGRNRLQEPWGRLKELHL